MRVGCDVSNELLLFWRQEEQIANNHDGNDQVLLLKVQPIGQ